MNNMIPFNKPFLTGKEAHYLYQAVYSGKISGNGIYTQKCQKFFEEKYSFKKTLLTTSCTDALEMAAILIDIQPDDEVIIPSFTFVSSANAFVLRGANIIFADSSKESPNIDVENIEKLITPRTKAIVIVHYAGIAVDMDEVMELAKKYNIFVIEDAAHSIDSYYKGYALGGIGHLGTFSFHETKNVISGEGGMLVVNDERFIKRAEIIWEKGTNRSAFHRGEVNKYGWMDIGSSFLPSEIVAAFLYAQLENLETIQHKRIWIWNRYFNSLKKLEDDGKVKLPVVPDYATLNGHMFYLICNSYSERNNLIDFLRDKGILSVFHYLSLHKSPFYKGKYKGGELIWSDYYERRLIRLPLFWELKEEEIDYIVKSVNEFYR